MKRLYFAVGQGFTSDGTPIRHHELVEWRIAASERISSTFGGMTTVNVMGWWISPSSNSAVHERSWGIEVYTDAHTASKAHEIASWLKAEFHQESVMLAVQTVDSLMFV